ncbi:MAG: hypothetical protein ACI9EF_003450 [Pseudohongiellaceae bacterium]|jgi:hypothetical protein
MNELDWRRLGFLTPDAPDCLREVWALQAMLQRHLGDSLSGLALETAEPSWEATLSEAAARSRLLADELTTEAGETAVITVADDELAREFDSSMAEVLASGHVPSLLVTGFAVVGELGRVPISLLEGVSGPYGRLLCGKIVSSEEHHLLGRLAGIVHLDSPAKTNLRRLLRHLNGSLFGVFESWRQTFHVLGVDGEDLARSARTSTSSAYETLGLKATRADLSLFGR